MTLTHFCAEKGPPEDPSPFPHNYSETAIR